MAISNAISSKWDGRFRNLGVTWRFACRSLRRTKSFPKKEGAKKEKREKRKEKDMDLSEGLEWERPSLPFEPPMN